MDQAVQVFGSLLILAGFVGAQFGVTSTKSRLYPALNLAGSILLAIMAAVGLQLGFLLLKGVGQSSQRGSWPARGHDQHTETAGRTTHPQCQTQ